MNRVFADACYWIALLNRHDELHTAAVAMQGRLRHAHVVTSDEVLTETLNLISGRAPQLRLVAANLVDQIRADRNVTVFEQSRGTFDHGLTLFRARSDKQYSLTDCSSFNVMQREGLTDSLTDDHHFVQEGFVALLRATRT